MRVPPFAIVLVAFAAVPTARGADAPNAEPLLSENFNGATGALAKAAVRHKRITLAKGAGPDGSDAIRVAYVGYERGSQRVVFGHRLAEVVQEATLAFDVKFEADFQWVKGGKLHGLGPQRPVTGGKKVNPDAWSARMMWGRDARLGTYLYHQSKNNKYGTGNQAKSPVFKKDRWHRVVLQVRVNDPGKANGAARVFVDGKPVVTTDQVQFRDDPGDKALIHHFMFSTFHGGNTKSWAPVDKDKKPTTVHALYDNVLVVKGITVPKR